VTADYYFAYDIPPLLVFDPLFLVPPGIQRGGVRLATPPPALSPGRVGVVSPVLDFQGRVRTLYPHHFRPAAGGLSAPWS